MAVYERRYAAYDGPLVRGWRRHLVIPRYAYEEAFASRRFVLLFAAGFLPAAVALLIVFLHHNVNALAMMQLARSDLIQLGPRFFQTLLTVQSGLAFLIALILGPSLVSHDLAHNALPLYLSRPIDRADYAVGKIAVLFLLMSAVTWMASLLVLVTAAGFAGGEWLAENAWVAVAIVAQGVLWCALVSTLAVALSAWLRWRPVAAGALLFLFLVPTGFAELFQELFGGMATRRWGYLISPTRSLEIVSDALFRRTATVTLRVGGQATPLDPPAWAAAGVLLLLVAAGVLLLNRRLEAHEVVT